MNHIEIVTHVYSGKEVPIYHKLLQLQLENLISFDHQKDLKVTVTVFYTMEDSLTTEVVHKFKTHCESYLDKKSNVCLNPISIKKKRLFRRAIGRNIAAKRTKADVVWFTDVDYLFFNTSLMDAHEKCSKSDLNMVFPNKVNIHSRHVYGDRLIQSVNCVGFNSVHSINFDQFGVRKEKRAIGGIQIVKGDWCREHGYLDGTKWLEPVDDEGGFRSCKCDVPFRKSVGDSERVEITGVYRIRHSQAGRDNGSVDHGSRIEELV